MLAVCLHKLCPQDSFEHAFRWVENHAKIAPRRVENRTVGAVRNGLLEPFGGLLCARWAPFGRQGRSEAELGRLLGRSWGAPGVFWGRLGASLAGPGASWAAPGPPGGLFLEVCRACFGGSRAETPTSTKPRKTRGFCCILRGLKASRSPPGMLENASGRPPRRLLGPKTGLEGPCGGTWGPSWAT